MPTHLVCQLVLQEENESDLAGPCPALAILQDQLAAARHPCKECEGAHVPTNTYCVAVSILSDNNNG